MTIEQLIFYVFAGLAILAALLILFGKNVLYNAFFLLLSFLSLAAVYVLAGAEFLAVTQIMVYVGGILVLLIFGVMFTNRDPSGLLVAQSKNKFVGIGISILAASFLSYGIFEATFVQTNQMNTSSNQVQEIGKKLMTSHLFPFEVAAILLLVALIGASLIAWQKK